MSRLAPSGPQAYLLWLKAWLAAGNAPTHYYDYSASRWNWLKAEADFRTGGECDAAAVCIVVPSGIRWVGGGLGNNRLYFMDGPSRAGGSVPVFSDPEYRSLGSEVLDFIRNQQEKNHAFQKRAAQASMAAPDSDVPRRHQIGKDEIMTESKDVYLIGEKYNKADASRKGVAVVRPAILEGAFNEEPRIITTTPCCTTETRRLDFNGITSDRAKARGGWPERCRHCKWHYRVFAEHTGQDPRLGLYGVRWISSGF